MPQPRGFALQSPERMAEIASSGGQAAHRGGHAHQFTASQARAAGKRGAEGSSSSWRMTRSTAPDGAQRGRTVAVQSDDIPETYTRFPRTLDEAFRTARYADPIHRPPRDYPPAWWACLWLAAVAACALAWVTR